jgi:protein-tyrosine phosphatase
MIAASYAAGAIVLIGLAWCTPWPWKSVLIWIALVLMIMASAYAAGATGVFCKRGGRIPWWVRIVLGPHVAGVHCVRRLQHAQANQPWSRIDEHVILGRVLNDRTARELLQSERVIATLDLTAEHAAPSAFANIAYRCIPVLDMTLPTPGQVRDAIAFIGEYSPEGTVYIYCGLGRSRSAMIAAAWLMSNGKARSGSQACQLIRALRPEVTLDARHEKALDQAFKQL